MSEESSLQPKSSDSDTKMYRPGAEGGLEAAPDSSADYRDQLHSRRWNAAPLENPEVEKTDPRIAVAAIVILGGVTLAVLVIGYGVLGLWSLPA
jgi:hypothetical protein